MKKLFVAWQDPHSRAWFPIGQLTYEGNFYQFAYIEGVREAQKKADFQGLWSFPDFDKVYVSKDLLPFFFNRVMRRSRPDYPEYIQWLNIPKGEDTPMAILARSGGTKVTDNFEVFPCPEPDERGRYHIYFFAHGLRYMPAETDNRISRLQTGELLRLAHDLQNPYDRRALMLIAEDRYILGYCPRYLLYDIFDVLQQYPDSVQVVVERVNPPPAPLQMRLLCHMTVQHNDFHPFSSPLYQPIPQPVAPQPA